MVLSSHMRARAVMGWKMSTIRTPATTVKVDARLRVSTNATESTPVSKTRRQPTNSSNANAIASARLIAAPLGSTQVPPSRFIAWMRPRYTPSRP